jgi:rare lipoprotein A
MKRISFKTAQRASSMSVRRFGVGILMMGLALTAAAKDGIKEAAKDGSSPTDQTPAAKTHAKAGPKARRWLQIGVASWYGSHFQGHKTATGEKFDMNQMTCAHPTLPMGTWLRVTNLKNRRTAFVRVNDRGPVLEGRIVDLSFAAARTLGLVGVGKVSLETVRSSDPELAEALVAQMQMPVLFNSLAFAQ